MNEACVDLQVVQQLVRRIPDGHQVKREVDFILNQISDTMTPMHYHIREVIFVTYNKVSSPVLITDDATHLSGRSVITSHCPLLSADSDGPCGTALNDTNAELPV